MTSLLFLTIFSCSAIKAVIRIYVHMNAINLESTVSIVTLPLTLAYIMFFFATDFSRLICNDLLWKRIFNHLSTFVRYVLRADDFRHRQGSEQIWVLEF